MPSILNRLMTFARSPQGRRVLRQASSKAQQMAKDPNTRARIEQARRKVGGGGTTPPPAS